MKSLSWLSKSKQSQTKWESTNWTKTLEDLLVSVLTPFPSIVIVNNLIWSDSCNWCLNVLHTSNWILTSHLDRLEVIILCFIEIRQIPENTNVFQTQIVPFVRVGVVWNFIFVNVLALPPGTSHSDKLTGVQFLRATPLITVFGRDPASVHDDSCTFNLNRVFLWKSILKGKFTTLITVERIDDIESFLSNAVNDSIFRNEDFLAHI